MMKANRTSSDCRENLEITTRFVKRDGSFKWRIANFSIWPTESCPEISSPPFNCCASTWALVLYPNGDSGDNQGNIGLFLRMITPDTEKTVKYKMCLKDRHDIGHYESNGQGVFHADDSCQGFSNMVRRDILLKEKHTELLCTDILTVYCELTVWENVVDGEMKRIKLRASLRRPAVFASKGTEILLNDMENLLKDEKNCDVILQAGDEKFPAHKLLLRARSKVFAAMFHHEMEDSRSNVVSITDIEGEILKELLKYIYCGNVKNLPFEKAIKLYPVADKYDLPDLKEQCADILLKHVNLENACDIVVLGDAHNDGLITDSLKVFARDNPHLLSTDKWKFLLDQNPRLAYEVAFTLMKNKN